MSEVHSISDAILGPPSREQIRYRKAEAKAAEARAGIWATLAATTIVLAFGAILTVPALVIWAYTILL